MKGMKFILSFCFLAAGLALDTFPLGVNFGLNYVTAALFSTSNETSPILVARILGSAEYQEYMMDTVSSIGKRIMKRGISYVEDDRGALVLAPPEQHDDEKAKRIFSEALTTIKNASLTSLDKWVPIGAISYPQHLNDSSRYALFETATGLEPSLFRSWQFRKFLHYARLAYSLDTCLGIGLNSTDCSVDDVGSEAIFINFEKQSLELTAADAGEFGTFPFSEVRIDLDHKDELVGGSADSSMDSSMSQSQRNKILLSLQEFVYANFKPTHNKDTEEKFRDFDYLRAVVLSSEALGSDMNEMRDLIRQALPSELHDKIRDSVDPGYIGAIGAAYQARIFIREPRILVDSDDGLGWESFVHEEL